MPFKRATKLPEVADLAISTGDDGTELTDTPTKLDTDIPCSLKLDSQIFNRGKELEEVRKDLSSSMSSCNSAEAKLIPLEKALADILQTQEKAIDTKEASLQKVWVEYWDICSKLRFFARRWKENNIRDSKSVNEYDQYLAWIWVIQDSLHKMQHLTLDLVKRDEYIPSADIQEAENTYKASILAAEDPVIKVREMIPKVDCKEIISSFMREYQENEGSALQNWEKRFQERPVRELQIASVPLRAILRMLVPQENESGNWVRDLKGIELMLAIHQLRPEFDRGSIKQRDLPEELRKYIGMETRESQQAEKIQGKLVDYQISFLIAGRVNTGFLQVGSKSHMVLVEATRHLMLTLSSLRQTYRSTLKEVSCQYRLLLDARATSESLREEVKRRQDLVKLKERAVEDEKADLHRVQSSASGTGEKSSEAAVKAEGDIISKCGEDAPSSSHQIGDRLIPLQCRDGREGRGNSRERGQVSIVAQHLQFSSVDPKKIIEALTERRHVRGREPGVQAFVVPLDSSSSQPPSASSYLVSGEGAEADATGIAQEVAEEGSRGETAAALEAPTPAASYLEPTSSSRIETLVPVQGIGASECAKDEASGEVTYFIHPRGLFIPNYPNQRAGEFLPALSQQLKNKGYSNWNINWLTEAMREASCSIAQDEGQFADLSYILESDMEGSESSSKMPGYNLPNTLLIKALAFKLKIKIVIFTPVPPSYFIDTISSDDSSQLTIFLYFSEIRGWQSVESIKVFNPDLRLILELHKLTTRGIQFANSYSIFNSNPYFFSSFPHELYNIGLYRDRKPTATDLLLCALRGLVKYKNELLGRFPDLPQGSAPLIKFVLAWPSIEKKLVVHTLLQAFSFEAEINVLVVLSGEVQIYRSRTHSTHTIFLEKVSKGWRPGKYVIGRSRELVLAALRDNQIPLPSYILQEFRERPYGGRAGMRSLSVRRPALERTNEGLCKGDGYSPMQPMATMTCGRAAAWGKFRVGGGLAGASTAIAAFSMSESIENSEVNEQKSLLNSKTDASSRPAQVRLAPTTTSDGFSRTPLAWRAGTRASSVKRPLTERSKDVGWQAERYSPRPPIASMSVRDPGWVNFRASAALAWARAAQEARKSQASEHVVPEIKGSPAGGSPCYRIPKTIESSAAVASKSLTTTKSDPRSTTVRVKLATTGTPKVWREIPAGERTRTHSQSVFKGLEGGGVRSSPLQGKSRGREITPACVIETERQPPRTEELARRRGYTAYAGLRGEDKRLDSSGHDRGEAEKRLVFQREIKVVADSRKKMAPRDAGAPIVKNRHTKESKVGDASTLNPSEDIALDEVRLQKGRGHESKSTGRFLLDMQAPHSQEQMLSASFASAVLAFQSLESPLPGFRVVNVAGDGNCFFHACVSNFQQISSEYSEWNHVQLRQRAVDYLAEHLTDFPEIQLDEAGNIDAALQRMRGNECADDCLIQAFVNTFEMTVLILQRNSDGQIIPILKNRADRLLRETAVLYYDRGGRHYQSVEGVSDWNAPFVRVVLSFCQEHNIEWPRRFMQLTSGSPAPGVTTQLSSLPAKMSKFSKAREQAGHGNSVSKGDSKKANRPKKKPANPKQPKVDVSPSAPELPSTFADPFGRIDEKGAKVVGRCIPTFEVAKLEEKIRNRVGTYIEVGDVGKGLTARDTTADASIPTVLVRGGALIVTNYLGQVQDRLFSIVSRQLAKIGYASSLDIEELRKVFASALLGSQNFATLECILDSDMASSTWRDEMLQCKALQKPIVLQALSSALQVNIVVFTLKSPTYFINRKKPFQKTIFLYWCEQSGWQSVERIDLFNADVKLVVEFYKLKDMKISVSREAKLPFDEIENFYHAALIELYRIDYPHTDLSVSRLIERSLNGIEKHKELILNGFSYSNSKRRNEASNFLADPKKYQCKDESLVSEIVMKATAVEIGINIGVGKLGLIGFFTSGAQPSMHTILVLKGREAWGSVFALISADTSQSILDTIAYIFEPAGAPPRPRYILLEIARHHYEYMLAAAACGDRAAIAAINKFRGTLGDSSPSAKASDSAMLEARGSPELAENTAADVAGPGMQASQDSSDEGSPMESMPLSPTVAPKNGPAFGSIEAYTHSSLSTALTLWKSDVEPNNLAIGLSHDLAQLVRLQDNRYERADEMDQEFASLFSSGYRSSALIFWNYRLPLYFLPRTIQNSAYQFLAYFFWLPTLLYSAICFREYKRATLNGYDPEATFSYFAKHIVFFVSLREAPFFMTQYYYGIGIVFHVMTAMQGLHNLLLVTPVILNSGSVLSTPAKVWFGLYALTSFTGPLLRLGRYYVQSREDYQLDSIDIFVDSFAPLASLTLVAIFAVNAGVAVNVINIITILSCAYLVSEILQATVLVAKTTINGIGAIYNSDWVQQSIASWATNLEPHLKKIFSYHQDPINHTSSISETMAYVSSEISLAGEGDNYTIVVT